MVGVSSGFSRGAGGGTLLAGAAAGLALPDGAPLFGSGALLAAADGPRGATGLCTAGIDAGGMRAAALTGGAGLGFGAAAG